MFDAANNKLCFDSSRFFIRRHLFLLFAFALHPAFAAWNFTCQSRRPGEWESSWDYCFIEASPTSHFDNNIIHYDSDDYISSVEFVSFADAPFDLGKVPTVAFTTFPELKLLNISKTNIGDVSASDFTQALKLKELYLDGNKIQAIKSNVFSTAARTAQQPSEIAKVALKSPFPLEKLKELLLSGNEISEIEDNSFYGLNDLWRLNLEKNRLTEIRSKMFTGLPSLSMLDLSYNQISDIADDAFQLPSLEYLYLNDNKLKRLPDTIFQHSPKLGVINLNNNMLEQIGKSMNGLPELRTVALSRNQIRDIDLTAFARLSNLHYLLLTKSGFTFATTIIEEGQTWDSPLIELEIDDNNISGASELIKLKLFAQLRKLDLNYNPLTNLDVGEGKTLKDILPALSTVKLHGSDINCLEMRSIIQNIENQGQFLKIGNDCEF